MPPPTAGGRAAGGVCPVIAGPTAVGKTALIVSLASRYPIEVISLDSRQIYAGMRIGTAQPTAQEQAACRHHLVDFVQPTERYSAARFRDDFTRAHHDIRSRGKLPLLVGGAGLYLRAVEEGLFDLAIPPATLAATRVELRGLPLEEVRTRLHAVDPESWARIHPADRYRSERALEIQMLTGETMTALIARQRHDPALGLAFPLVYLTRPRPELHARIAARTRAMLAAGWIEETEALIARHGADARALRTIGYREIVAHLQKGPTSVPDVGVHQSTGSLQATSPDLEDAINRATRQYAKRQETWFKPLPAVASGPPEQPDIAAALQRLLGEALSVR